MGYFFNKERAFEKISFCNWKRMNRSLEFPIYFLKIQFEYLEKKDLIQMITEFRGKFFKG